MSDMISKQAVVKWLDQQIGIFKVTKEEEIEQILVLLKRHINDGLFDSSNQGEAARLREALEWIVVNFDSEKSGLSDSEYHRQMLKIAREALSSHTEETGIQKVRGRLTERFFRTDGTPFVAYCGSKNPYNVALTIGEVLISSKPREILEEIFERLAMYEDTLRITIPGITDGESS